MSTHSWAFFRAGGVDQVNLRTGADLVALESLDQKLWVALACPVDGLEFDSRTLAYIDADGDRRVKALELIAAVKWAGGLLTDVEQLARRVDDLPLAAIDRKKDEGALLHATATAMLASVGKAGKASLSVAEADEAMTAFNKTAFNGDGVVPASSVPDDDTRAALVDLLACTATPATDRSGDPGMDAAALDAFFASLGAFVAWREAGRADGVLPLGADTDAAWSALQAVAARVDDYFARARVAAFDARALGALNTDEAGYGALTRGLLSGGADQLRDLPLAIIEAGRPLPLVTGVNPAWGEAVTALRTRAVTPLLGDQDSLSEADWATLRGKLAAYGAWLGAKGGAAVEALGEDRARALLGGSYKDRLAALIARDAAEAPRAAALSGVDKLVRYNRDLMNLANNFVSFRDFYGRKGPAIFQVGTLYLDQRACDLCVEVNDAGKHASLAPLSQAYLVYCALRNAQGKTRTIVAAMTNGDTDNLMVGRNGVFYDRAGKDWDATVTRIVENPISVRQAFWTPYKKLIRAVEDLINSRAAASAAAADARVGTAGANVASATEGKPAPVEAPKKLDIGVVAAIGVAVGGISAAIGALLSAFFGLGFWMPLGVLGLMLLISGPSMAVAWLKLRQRNIGPILDANGWAVNVLTRVNVPLGRSFTSVATLPEGAQRDLADPFAEKPRPWWLWATLALLAGLALGWYIGKLDAYLPPAARSVTVLGEAAPAHVTVPPVEAPAEAPAAPAQ